MYCVQRRLIRVFNPLCTSGLSNGCMFDESICCLGVSGLFCRFYSILMENLLANIVEPDQLPLFVASDLGLQSIIFHSFSSKCWN